MLQPQNWAYYLSTWNAVHMTSFDLNYIFKLFLGQVIENIITAQLRSKQSYLCIKATKERQIGHSKQVVAIDRSLLCRR